MYDGNRLRPLKTHKDLDWSRTRNVICCPTALPPVYKSISFTKPHPLRFSVIITSIADVYHVPMESRLRCRSMLGKFCSLLSPEKFPSRSTMIRAQKHCLQGERLDSRLPSLPCVSVLRCRLDMDVRRRPLTLGSPIIHLITDAGLNPCKVSRRHGVVGW